MNGGKVKLKWMRMVKRVNVFFFIYYDYYLKLTFLNFFVRFDNFLSPKKRLQEKC